MSIVNQHILDSYNYTLDDFLSFCEERYSIFLKKELGEPRPWTTDPTLDKYKFTNLFREDDKVSRWIFKWVEPIKDDLPKLLSNLLYARLCNRISTMERTGYLGDPEKFIRIINEIGGGKRRMTKAGKMVDNINPVFHDPYQTTGCYSKLFGYSHREQLIATHIPKVINDLVKVIEKHKGNDIQNTLIEIGKVWGYNATFMFTQVLLDLTYMRPDLIPVTIIPQAGSGVIPVANMLRIEPEDLIIEAMNIWNTKSKYKSRKMYPKDSEHSLCEFRKYLSWKNGLSNAKLYKKIP